MKTIFILFLAVFLIGTLKAEQSDTSILKEYRDDFNRVSDAYTSMEHTSISIIYRYKLSDHPDVIQDSSVANYRFHKGMMKGDIDGLELLRNKELTITVNKEDSFITVSKAGTDAGPLQLNIFDSAFRETNIQGFKKDKLPGGQTKISLLFKRESFYKRYELIYNNNFLITNLSFEILDTDYDENGMPPPIGRNKIVEISYGDYHTSDFDTAIFDESQYVKKDENGNWIGAGRFSNCEIFFADPPLTQ